MIQVDQLLRNGKEGANSMPNWRFRVIGGETRFREHTFIMMKSPVWVACPVAMQAPEATGDFAFGLGKAAL